MAYYSIDNDLIITESDKEKLDQIKRCILRLVEPKLYVKGGTLFNNLTLDRFFDDLIELIDDIDDKGHFTDYVNGNDRLHLEVKVVRE